MGWVGDVGGARDQASWVPLTEDLRRGAATVGSVMFTGDAPRDPNGLPFQVVVLADERGELIGLMAADDGTPLTWVLTADGTDDVRDEHGRVALRPAPPEIAAAGWDWLATERDDPAG